MITRNEILAKIIRANIDMGSHGTDLSDAAEQTHKRYASQIKQLEEELDNPQLCQCGKLYRDCDGKHPITITAPKQSQFGDLVYWHQRASKMAPGRDIIVTTDKENI